jgi:hypothetical protein
MEPHVLFHRPSGISRTRTRGEDEDDFYGVGFFLEIVCVAWP